MINLSFVGDISFNDVGKNKKIDISTYLKLNSNTDFSVANLEAMASIGDYNPLKKPRVTTNIDTLNTLKELGINLITLAHNHVYDAELSGFKSTIEKLKELEIPFLGAGLNQKEAEKPYILDCGNIKIGFLNYCTEDTNPSLPENCEVFLNIYDPDKIKKDILSLLKQCNHVVLLLHWGGSIEGGYFPDKYQIEDAKKFSEAGASLIVGHHPHTLQPHMTMENTPIYFSLGNFIFYDIKHENSLIRLSPRRKRGGMLQICFSHIKIEKNALFYTSFLQGEIRIKVTNIIYELKCLAFKKLYNTNLFWKFYKTQFNYINPLFYFLFIQEGGLEKFKNLNLGKIKKYLWKR